MVSVPVKEVREKMSERLSTATGKYNILQEEEEDDDEEEEQEQEQEQEHDDDDDDDDFADI